MDHLAKLGTPTAVRWVRTKSTTAAFRIGILLDEREMKIPIIFGMVWHRSLV
jgi:hypothetical protein